jgi:hypothetical protein
VGSYLDLFIASRDEAEAVVESDSLFTDWPSLSIKSIFAIELSELWTLIDDIDPATGTGEFFGDLLYQGPGSEPIVCTISERFVDALAKIPVEDAGKYAVLWAKAEYPSETRA